MASETTIVKGSAALDALQKKLQVLKDRADSLVVRDQEGCIVAKNLKLDIQAYAKAVKFETGPEIEIAKERLRALQSQEKMLLAPAESMLETADNKRKSWEEEERRKAAEEQRRINEENRIAAQKKADEERTERERIAMEERKQREEEAKRVAAEAAHEAERARKAGEIGKREAERQKKEAAEQMERDRKAAAEAEAREKARAAQDAKEMLYNMPQVSVKPNIPTVQGVASRQNWKFKIADETKVPRIWCMPNEVAIGRFVRDAKSKEKAEAAIPGIEVWSE
jgi:hypothetical protein